MADFPMSPTELAAITSAIQQIAFDVDQLTAKIVGSTTRVKERVEKDLGEIGGKADKTMDAIDRRYEQMEREGILRLSKLTKGWYDLDKALDKVQYKYKQIGDEMKRQLGMSERQGPIASTLGLSGPRGVGNAVMGQYRAVTSQLPMGGLLGLMLYGRMQKTEWQAAATAATRQFAQVGTVGAAEIGRVNTLSQKLAGAWGMDPGAVSAELGQAAAAFTQFGASSKEALADSGLRVGKMKQSVLGISFAMDSLLKVGPGTFATAIGQAVESSGEFVRKVTQEIVGLGLSLRNTGANVGQFIGTLMQATSGLRLQGQSVGDLANQYSILYGAFEGGAMRGKSKEYIARSSLAGIQAVAGGIGQMSEGLSAVIGQRIGARTGKSVSGIDAIIAMQEGTAGRGGQFMGDVVHELGTLAKEITGGGSRNEQIFALMKTNPSLGFEGARAVVEVNKAMEKDMAKGLTLNEAIEKHQGTLNKAFMGRAAETSAYQKAMKQLMQALVKIASGLLDITLSAFQAIPAMVTSINPLSSAEQRDAASNYLMQASKQQTEGMTQVWEGLRGMKSIGLNLARTTVGTGYFNPNTAYRPGVDDRGATLKNAGAQRAALKMAGQLIENWDQADLRAKNAVKMAGGYLKDANLQSPEGQKALREALLHSGVVEANNGTYRVKIEFIKPATGGAASVEGK